GQCRNGRLGPDAGARSARVQCSVRHHGGTPDFGRCTRCLRHHAADVHRDWRLACPSAPRSAAMTVDLLHVLHQALFGAVAASGFGVLFNFGWRDLRWCATSGALALTIRTLGQNAGWSLEAATFAAAAAVGF